MWCVCLTREKKQFFLREKLIHQTVVLQTQHLFISLLRESLFQRVIRLRERFLWFFFRSLWKDTYYSSNTLSVLINCTDRILTQEKKKEKRKKKRRETKQRRDKKTTSDKRIFLTDPPKQEKKNKKNNKTHKTKKRHPRRDKKHHSWRETRRICSLREE